MSEEPWFEPDYLHSSDQDDKESHVDWMEEQRVLDDHFHDEEDTLLELIEDLARDADRNFDETQLEINGSDDTEDFLFDWDNHSFCNESGRASATDQSVTVTEDIELLMDNHSQATNDLNHEEMIQQSEAPEHLEEVQIESSELPLSENRNLNTAPLLDEANSKDFMSQKTANEHQEVTKTKETRRNKIKSKSVKDNAAPRRHRNSNYQRSKNTRKPRKINKNHNHNCCSHCQLTPNKPKEANATEMILEKIINSSDVTEEFPSSSEQVIGVTLKNLGLWKELQRIGQTMLVRRENGSSLFPTLGYDITGLNWISQYKIGIELILAEKIVYSDGQVVDSIPEEWLSDTQYGIDILKKGFVLKKLRLKCQTSKSSDDLEEEKVEDGEKDKNTVFVVPQFKYIPSMTLYEVSPISGASRVLISNVLFRETMFSVITYAASSTDLRMLKLRVNRPHCHKEFEYMRKKKRNKRSALANKK